MTADPKDLAARPAFRAMLQALRGGEGPCPAGCRNGRVDPPCDTCEGVGRVADPDSEYSDGTMDCPDCDSEECGTCAGSGRVAVPPDLTAAGILSDWWQDDGQVAALAGLLVAFAGLTEPCGACDGVGSRGERAGLPTWACVDCSGSGTLPDPCLSHALAAWDDAACPARAAAVRGLHVHKHRDGVWCVRRQEGLCDATKDRAADFYPTEPAARLALKAAVLRCFDPGNPYDGGAGVRIAMRAEGARLTVRHAGQARDAAAPLWRSGRPFVPHVLGDRYSLDGARVGAPPGWSWTPHALRCGPCGGTGHIKGGYTLADSGEWQPAGCHACGGSGFRLAVTWECRPSDLLPSAGETVPA